MDQTERATGGINDLSPSADLQAASTGSMLNLAGRVAEQLQTALSVLATIDKATGILVSRGRGSPERAAAALRWVSQSRHTDVATIARQIVEEVSRQSNARHAQG